MPHEHVVKYSKRKPNLPYDDKRYSEFYSSHYKVLELDPFNCSKTQIFPFDFISINSNR